MMKEQLIQLLKEALDSENVIEDEEDQNTVLLAGYASLERMADYILKRVV